MTPLAETLGLTAGAPGVVLNAPARFGDRLLLGAEAPTVWTEGAEPAAWGLAFCMSAVDVDRFAAVLHETLRPDGVLWMAFPNADDGPGALSRSIGWGALYQRGYFPIAEITLDRAWRALRFRQASLLKA